MDNVVFAKSKKQITLLKFEYEIAKDPRMILNDLY